MMVGREKRRKRRAVRELGILALLRLLLSGDVMRRKKFYTPKTFKLFFQFFFLRKFLAKKKCRSHARKSFSVHLKPSHEVKTNRWLTCLEFLVTNREAKLRLFQIFSTSTLPLYMCVCVCVGTMYGCVCESEKRSNFVYASIFVARHTFSLSAELEVSLRSEIPNLLCYVITKSCPKVLHFSSILRKKLSSNKTQLVMFFN